MTRILMFTNTYTPHVGGVARSVSELAQGLRDVGDETLVIAPDFENMPATEEDVYRVPAMQNFAGSDFSVPLPLSGNLAGVAHDFQPDIIHSHHPFLLGDTALRAASSLGVPVVFTHHTRYELYGHYVEQNSNLLKRLALSLSLGYCGMCDSVIAPSQSIAAFLADHGVKTPIEVIPTGVHPEVFSNGEGSKMRLKLGIPDDVLVVGHVGRLAPEKNLGYLATALAVLSKGHTKAHILIVGDGPSRDQMIRILCGADADKRVHFTGKLTGRQLANAYAAMDLFAFSSFSETQGLVLAEAMTAGIPVVALDAPGAREVVRDGRNGRLLDEDADAFAFAAALGRIATAKSAYRRTLQNNARRTAEQYSIDKTIKRTRDFYAQTLRDKGSSSDETDSLWQRTRRAISREMDIVGNIASAANDAMFPDSAEEKRQ
ncbi:MAG: glycosyltransferase [Alphaproteobacteria bacterium]|nr:glycosyltransferase [Alphaproteobacteria bacterium]